LETGALYDALQAEISLFRDLCEPLFERFGSTNDTVRGRRSETKWSGVGTRAERRGRFGHGQCWFAPDIVDL
jgi:hypothetical protein